MAGSIHDLLPLQALFFLQELNDDFAEWVL
jgi:hypothetical protein